MKRSSSDESIADALDETRWDHVPDRSGGALLKSMHRYFRGFPWGGPSVQDTGPAESAPEPEDDDIANADFDVD